ncbi:tRNA glutamyl-Q(34) synthetase GluQRS [Candidatus Poriferisodalis sp.]|uniref:tRNA glutamyl-Q(34) synthetase GluQRS n=1 Tax=Candidatus Poriferisodalis sp. TaxID=3101277 RepID=UPI003D0AFBD5
MSEPSTTGRWAPSPTGDLHLGNLRTALLAWLFARSADGDFGWRFEDLDNAVRPQFYDSQLRDVAALGLDWDGEPIRQSERRELYRDAIADLERRGLTYECFCTRREIAEAATAPHGPAPEGAYPGTCRALTAAERAHRRSAGRPAALRVRVNPDDALEGRSVTLVDRQLGSFSGTVDDFVLRRGDGTPAYNLAVVVDDGDQGVTEVVRGDDLLPSTPRQVHLARLLGIDAPAYAHVPMVLGRSGQRLAKRDGAITLADRRALGETTLDVLNLLLHSLGIEPIATAQELPATAAVFQPAALPTDPWTLPLERTTVA